MAGRKTKLNAGVQREIVRAIESGAFDYVAAEAVGIARSTFYDWMERGAKGEESFSEFSDKVTKAKAKARKKAEARVYKENPLAWLRNAARDKENAEGWTEKSAIEHGVKDNKPIPVTLIPYDQAMNQLTHKRDE